MCNVKNILKKNKGGIKEFPPNSSAQQTGGQAGKN
jgi:hypothetical protein